MLASASAFNAYVGIAVDLVCFFMALLSFSWNRHPEPKGSRRATPLLPFQHSSGHPQATADGKIEAIRDAYTKRFHQ